eukprot:SAG31_NODE_3284_length_4464_cov_5.447194_3_plen_432_part_00
MSTFNKNARVVLLLCLSLSLSWGFNWAYMDQQHYTNPNLAYALANIEDFAKIQSGWVEQRQYVDHTVNALAAAHESDAGAKWLHARTLAELRKLRTLVGPSYGSALSTDEWAEIDSSKPISLPHFPILKFNTTAGGIAELRSQGSDHNFARTTGGSLAQYQYQTLDENDFWVFMNETLKVKREVAFGKANLSKNSDITSGFWSGKLLKTYRRRVSNLNRGKQQMEITNDAGEDSVDSFIQLIEMPSRLHSYYGAPSQIWTRFDFSRQPVGETQSVVINITMSWVNKTRTRLPEAHWMDFEVAVPEVIRVNASEGASRCDSWTVAKLGSTFCATDVDLFGSTHLHAVNEEGGVQISSGQTALRLRTFDAALVSLEYKTAFPSPVHKILDAGRVSQNAYVNLCNNFWTTNYPNWYPFMDGDENSTFRFELILG